MTPRDFTIGSEYRASDYRFARQRTNLYIPIEPSPKLRLAWGYDFACGLMAFAALAIILLVTA